MQNLLNQTENCQHSEAEPPEALAAKVEALRASLKEELPDFIREVMREELAAHRQRKEVPELLEREAAAEALRISQRKLSTLTAAGEVACVRIGRRVLYPAGALRAFIRRQAEGGRL